LHHLSIAYGSLREVETPLLIAHSLDYLPSESLNELMEKAGKTGALINSLSNKLKEKLSREGTNPQQPPSPDPQ